MAGSVQFRWQSTADCIGFSFRKRIRYSSFCTCDTGHPGGLCGAEQRNGAGKRYEPVTVVVSVRLQNLDLNFVICASNCAMVRSGWPATWRASNLCGAAKDEMRDPSLCSG